MPHMDNLEPIPKRDMHIFYVLDTSSEERDFQDLRNVLLYMRRKFGLEVFRNPLRMASIITDLSPALRRDANILRRLGDAGLLAELEQADSRNWTRVIAKTRYWMENEWFMREEQAAYYAQALEILYHPENNVSAIPKSPKIEKLNRLVMESLEILGAQAKKWEHEYIRAKIAVLAFDSDFRYETPNGPENLREDFAYDPLKAGSRESNLGAALRELNSKLSPRGWLCSFSFFYNYPIIIFVTDGHATDDYMSALEEIRKNRWFHRATKIGFALSDGADIKAIASVVGNMEAVLQAADMALFERLLKNCRYCDYLVDDDPIFVPDEQNPAVIKKPEPVHDDDGWDDDDYEW